MGRLFGTDGVRGIANTELGCELAFKIGQAGALILANEVHRPRILIGRDTRISGKMLLYALTAGICSVGAEAVDLGVLPTPGVAHLVRSHGADAAVVISASHNSFEYNGIKWFNAQGYKLSDELEDEIEAMIQNGLDQNLPTGSEIGLPVPAPNAAQEYIEHLLSCCASDVSGLKVVVDCANGAASAIAPALFTRLGARMIAYFDQPDGTNINAKCGSTHPKRLQQYVVENGADIGFAFDGDADRLIAVDEYGVLVDGDRVMAMCALDMKQSGRLAQNTVVATVMSNLGMKICMQENDINVIATDVGDRYVLACMRENGYNLGGEQSGHIIFSDKSTTGDGLLSALEVLGIMARRKERLSSLARVVNIFPQILLNVRVDNEKKDVWQQQKFIAERIEQTESQLGERGRVLVRASGTEPLLRIMIEGEDSQWIESEAIAIARLMETHLDGKIN